MALKARLADAQDAAAIAVIYNQGIEDRQATFETQPRTADTVAELLRARTDRYPAVVVEDHRNVLGFAWTSEYRPRAVYRGVAGFGIYVTPSAPGQRGGRLGLGQLIN